jgi:hypothetical protein
MNQGIMWVLLMTKPEIKNLKQVYLNIFLDMDTDTFYILS